MAIIRIMILVCLLPFYGVAQSSIQLHPSLLSVHFSAYTFKRGVNDPRWSGGAGLSLLKGYRPHLDGLLDLRGTFTDRAAAIKDGSGKKYLWLELSASARWRPANPKLAFQPYFLTGFSLAHYDKLGSLNIPAAVGMEIRLFPEVYTFLEGRYTYPLNQTMRSYLNITLGVSGLINSRRTPKIKIPPPSVSKNINSPKSYDRDNDGIIDSLDACPDLPGLREFSGCPDTDQDSIADPYDHCPLLFGLARYQGCPIPDRDHDGVNDEIDQCPDIPGIVDLKGCPMKDRDGDGVADSLDECPDFPGDRTTKGCPLSNVELENRLAALALRIHFESGKYQISSSSFPALDSVASLLKIHSKVNLLILGHTDNVGSEADNLQLSWLRARAICNYLVNKEIQPTRLTPIGHGEAQPVGNNNTPDGRANNRRVNLIIPK